MICPTCRATVWFDTDLLGRSLEICHCGPKRMTPPQLVPIVIPLRIVYGTRTCPGCGNEFSMRGRRADARYHSQKCQKNHWARQERARMAEQKFNLILVRCSA